MEGCIFCQIIAGQKSAHIIDEDDDLIVFLSLEGYPLIVTKKHYRDMFELDEKIAILLAQKRKLIARAMSWGLPCEGVSIRQNNGSAAGQTVFHYHEHVRPHWAGKSLLDFDKDEFIRLIKRQLGFPSLINRLE